MARTLTGPQRSFLEITHITKDNYLTVATFQPQSGQLELDERHIQVTLEHDLCLDESILYNREYTDLPVLRVLYVNNGKTQRPSFPNTNFRKDNRRITNVLK